MGSGVHMRKIKLFYVARLLNKRVTKMKLLRDKFSVTGSARDLHRLCKGTVIILTKIGMFD